MTLSSEAEICDAVRAAQAAKTPLRIVAGGTRQPIGRPVAGKPLSLTGLTGVSLYEPAEMVIGAKAGTPLRDIQNLLAQNRQMLPFEPMDHRALLGTSGEPSIGAIAAGNISGPRRISAGAARDSLIGVRFVNGRGEAVKSGGRVMKNVTGLDLVKLQAGAWGTLGVLTEVIFKVIPQPQASCSLALHGLDDANAIRALTTALSTPFEVSGAAHLPATDGQPARTLVRLENFEASLKYRAQALSKHLKPFGTAEILDVDESTRLWAEIANAVPIMGQHDTAVWRLSVRPTHGPAVVHTIKASINLSAYFYDWSGGLIWLATDANGDAGAKIIRAAVDQSGGHATLIRAPDTLRAAIACFHPEPAAMAKLAEGIRHSVDPDTLFNPGLMR